MGVADEEGERRRRYEGIVSGRELQWEVRVPWHILIVMRTALAISELEGLVRVRLRIMPFSQLESVWTVIGTVQERGEQQEEE